MNPARQHGGWLIASTFLVALILDILPLPLWAKGYRPDWAALVLLYWCIFLPERIGVGIAWVVGLVLDVLQGTLLGQHALGFAIIGYLAVTINLRVRMYPLWQQAFVVMVLLGLNRLLLLWFDGMVGDVKKEWTYWLPTLVGMLLWPWIYLVLRDLSRRMKLS